MKMSKWHNNRTVWESELKDLVNPYLLNDKAKMYDSFREMASKTPITSELKGLVWSAIAHFSFVEHGRPAYLVSKDVWDVATSLELSKIDTETWMEYLPYPCFALVLERGIKIEGDEIESIFIEHRSTFREFENDSKTDLISWRIVGQKSKTIGGDGGLHNWLQMGERSSQGIKILKTTAALLLLWRARPHFVKPFVLPRSERYEFKGNRELIRTWVLPTELITRIKSSTTGEGGGWTVQPHWRAGHFRHYRHERYERNADGSVRVEFIEPCFIGDGNLQ